MDVDKDFFARIAVFSPLSNEPEGTNVEEKGHSEEAHPVYKSTTVFKATVAVENEASFNLGCKMDSRDVHHDGGEQRVHENRHRGREEAVRLTLQDPGKVSYTREPQWRKLMKFIHSFACGKVTVKVFGSISTDEGSPSSAQLSFSFGQLDAAIRHGKGMPKSCSLSVHATEPSPSCNRLPTQPNRSQLHDVLQRDDARHRRGNILHGGL